MIDKKGQFRRKASEMVQELPDVADLVDEWLSTIKIGDGTRDNYKTKIAPFVTWYGDRAEFKQSDCQRFIDWLIDNGHSDKNQFEIIRRVKQFLKWLYDGSRIDFNCSKWFPKIEVERELRSPISPDDIAKIMTHADRGELPERDRAMLACMLGTGIRRAECQQLKIEDVTLEADGSGYLIIRKAKKVKGRAVHQRRVAFDASTGHYLRLWMDTYGSRSGWLWPSFSKIEKRFTDQPLSLRGFNRVVDKIYTAAGVSGRVVGCHDLRRIFITYWRKHHGENHDNLLTLQVGHTNSTMTDLYDLADFENVREVIVSPVRKV